MPEQPDRLLDPRVQKELRQNVDVRDVPGHTVRPTQDHRGEEHVLDPIVRIARRRRVFALDDSEPVGSFDQHVGVPGIASRIPYLWVEEETSWSKERKFVRAT